METTLITSIKTDSTTPVRRCAGNAFAAPPCRTRIPAHAHLSRCRPYSDGGCLGNSAIGWALLVGDIPESLRRLFCGAIREYHAEIASSRRFPDDRPCGPLVCGRAARRRRSWRWRRPFWRRRSRRRWRSFWRRPYWRGSLWRSSHWRGSLGWRALRRQATFRRQPTFDLPIYGNAEFPCWTLFRCPYRPDSKSQR